MRSMILRALFVAMALSTSVASANEFMTTGHTCIPTEVAIQGDLFYNNFGGNTATHWNSGASGGTITLHCGIPVDVASPSHLWLLFANNTGCSGCASDKVL